MKVFSGDLWNRPAKIVLGIDIGTTQTAVSFAYLQPGLYTIMFRALDSPFHYFFQVVHSPFNG